MHQIENNINIIGISIMTSNEAAFTQNTIEKLWQEFFKNPIKEKLSNLLSTSIYAVYSDYENGYNGKYRITIGYAVKETNEIPNGLTKTIIPAGKYKIFQSKSHAPEDIVDTWKIIWKSDSNIFQPDFKAMYEEYKNTNEVMVHVSYT